MKILIVSDTHGRGLYLKKTLERVCPVDLMIHLGDYEGGEKYIKSIAPCRTEMISGNNDFFNGLPKEKTIRIGNYNVMLTHGQRYGVYSGTYLLREAAKKNHADIVMFGHTHIPVIEYKDGIWIINPGSLAFPRQHDRMPTFVIMEIDDKGEVHFTLNHIRAKDLKE